MCQTNCTCSAPSKPKLFIVIRKEAGATISSLVYDNVESEEKAKQHAADGLKSYPTATYFIAVKTHSITTGAPNVTQLAPAAPDTK